MENFNLVTFFVLIFLLINLFIGIWAGRGVKTIEDYAIGKKNWSTGALSMTYIATLLTGGAVLRAPVNVKNIGIYAVFGVLGYLISLPFRYFFFSKKGHFLKKYISFGDIFEDLYGKLAKKISSTIAIIFTIIMFSMELCVLALLLEKIGFNSNFSYIISSIILSTYTIIGGINSSVVTSIIKFIFIFLSIFIILNVCVYKVGGVSNLFDKNTLQHFLVLDKKNFPYIISMFFFNSVFSTDTFWPASIKRIFTVKNANQLKYLFLFSALAWFLFASSLIVLAISIYKLSNGQEKTVFFFIENFLSENYKIIIVLGILSFILSSANSFLHTIIILFINDLGPTKLKNNITLRIITGFFFSFLSIFLAKKGSAFFRLDYLNGIISPTLSPTLTLFFLNKRPNKNLFYISSGLGVFLFLVFKLNFLGEFFSNYSILISSFVSMIILCSPFVKDFFDTIFNSKNEN